MFWMVGDQEETHRENTQTPKPYLHLELNPRPSCYEATVQTTDPPYHPKIMRNATATKVTEPLSMQKIKYALSDAPIKHVKKSPLQRPPLEKMLCSRARLSITVPKSYFRIFLMFRSKSELLVRCQKHLFQNRLIKIKYSV